jgi:hypothetical protein
VIPAVEKTSKSTGYQQGYPQIEHWILTMKQILQSNEDGSIELGHCCFISLTRNSAPKLAKAHKNK